MEEAQPLHPTLMLEAWLQDQCKQDQFPIPQESTITGGYLVQAVQMEEILPLERATPAVPQRILISIREEQVTVEPEYLPLVQEEVQAEQLTQEPTLEPTDLQPEIVESVVTLLPDQITEELTLRQRALGQETAALDQTTERLLHQLTVTVEDLVV